MSDHVPARRTDPATSYIAAYQAMSKAPVIRDVIVDIFVDHHPDQMTQHQVIGEYNKRRVLDPRTPAAGDSSIRTRISELESHGVVRKVTGKKGKSTSGRPAMLHELAPAFLAANPDLVDADDDSSDDAQAAAA